jgi:predicted patatin/cPLA2 family phospholipase
MTHHTALVVEGGAMRSVFSAGLLDGFLEQQFNPFDFYIGVSAGANNLVAYLAGTPRKSLKIYVDFALRKEFINYLRFIRGGHLLDLDWLAKATYARSHIDVDAVFRHARPLYVGVTDVATGKAKFIKATPDNLLNAIKASTALPVFYRGFPEVNGRPMTDGGVAEGIPVAEAIRRGAKHIMVVRSHHARYLKQDTLQHRYIRWKTRQYPALTATMRNRVAIHADSIALIQNPPPEVTIVEICPPENFTIGRFHRNREHLLQGYQSGMQAAGDAITRWSSAISSRRN